MPVTPCRSPRCPFMATYRGYCKNHVPRVIQSKDEPRVYDRQKWKRTREKKLSLDPICESKDCETIAEQVDHIKPISDGGAEFDMDNLQSLCPSCHSKKTNAEVRNKRYE